jgi:hypothetical protein
MVEASVQARLGWKYEILCHGENLERDWHYYQCPKDSSGEVERTMNVLNMAAEIRASD